MFLLMLITADDTFMSTSHYYFYLMNYTISFIAGASKFLIKLTFYNTAYSVSHTFMRINFMSCIRPIAYFAIRTRSLK